MIVFNVYDYLIMNDLERCPYPMFTKECGEWCEQDDKRKILIALDRYADVLQNYTMITRQKCITWRE